MIIVVIAKEMFDLHKDSMITLNTSVEITIMSFLRIQVTIKYNIISKFEAGLDLNE